MDALRWLSASWGPGGAQPVAVPASVGSEGRLPARADEMESFVCLCGKLSWPKQVESRGNYPSIWGKCVFSWPKYLKSYLNYSLIWLWWSGYIFLPVLGLFFLTSLRECVCVCVYWGWLSVCVLVCLPTQNLFVCSSKSCNDLTD